MPPKPPEKKKPAAPAPAPPPAKPTPPQPAPARRNSVATSIPSPPGDVGIAVSSDAAAGGVVTARRAGGLRDMGLAVDPEKVGVKAALQHLAKAVNIAFQTDYGENYLEAVYQAAIVRNGRIVIVHKEYFGFGDSWFGQFGMLLRSLQLTLEGSDPASPEGIERIKEKGPSTIRGLFSLMGRKMDLVAEFEDRVPAYVEQMFDRLEGSGIIVGWDRNDWIISTSRIGLNVVISPSIEGMEQEVPA